jgi:hypothetical protein
VRGAQSRRESLAVAPTGLQLGLGIVLGVREG